MFLSKNIKYLCFSSLSIVLIKSSSFFALRRTSWIFNGLLTTLLPLLFLLIQGTDSTGRPAGREFRIRIWAAAGRWNCSKLSRSRTRWTQN